MKKKILFISIAFPPKSDPECLQTAKYFYHLQQYKDLQIDVVTSAVPTLYMSYDQRLEPYAEGVHQLINVKIKENRWVNIFRSRLGLQETVFPDSKASFHKQSKRVIKQLKNTPSIIYSRSFPLSSAMMALKLKRYYNIPWIMHLSDPWVGSPLHHWSESYTRRHADLEKECISEASAICFTSMATIRFYENRYPAYKEKFHFFPNVYERPEVVHAAELLQPPPHPFTIVYTGGLAGDRSPAFLLEPLRQIFEEDSLIANKIKVVFAGEADHRNRSVFAQYSLPFVSYRGKLSYQEALALQRQADYLVVIDSPIPDPAMSMFFPSKLLDYMVARKRILAVTTRGSATDEVMKDLKGDVCTHEDVTDIKQKILVALRAFECNNTDYLTNTCMPHRYEARHNAERLFHLIQQLSNV